ncbi:DNA cytosine methyltransferase [Shewanella sp. BF02_Schw]|uniref:DNA cytosine methyltransferase n=1 Tax=Shewanella sp. BF02_Schw TaxID=394908 RepID=UPI0017818CD2|nr:DNA cytosine methyltransferase [Shewanella sp. BF02_Schw]MBO1897731.1 DNA cytosine methyltransferase [Shewanella sp. BF02_Schw]
MNAIEHRYYKIGTSSKGLPRIWLQGAGLLASNFIKGRPYTVILNVTNRTIILKLLDKVVDNCRCVSGRKRHNFDSFTPIVELSNSELVTITGLSTRVRADFYENEIHISIHHLDKKIEEREARLAKNLSNGFITKAVLCAGIGISAAAGYDVLTKSGLKCRTEFVVDRERQYLDVLSSNNHSIDDSTVIFESTLEEMEPELVGFVDCISFSLACTGMGSSGKAKNKIDIPEEHSTDATGIFGLVKLIERCQPSILVSENVVGAVKSATYVLLKSLLAIYGYNVTEKVLNSTHTHSIENRERYWFVATSAGLSIPDLENFPVFQRVHQHLSSILETIPYAHKMWKSSDEKVRKAALNKTNGKNFAFNLVSPTVSKIGVCGKGYNKNRATECHIAGPNNLSRLLTVQELAKAQSVPLHLIDGVVPTIAYQGLGQGVDYRQAQGVFECVARDVLSPIIKTILALKKTLPPKCLAIEHSYF